ncbi:MAG TPA: hypothetical protein VGD60_02225 [Candidatus Acidoferrales bacterium]
MEMIRKKKKANSLLWLYEPLEGDSRYLCKRFFSFEAAYLDGRLCLAVVDRGEPWNGMMACTSREHHASLLAQFPALTPHKVLGKWLYISQMHPEFEGVAAGLVELARRRDVRLGVDVETRKQRRAKAARTKTRAKKRR